MAVALFSGGKDSTYSIYKTSKKYNISTLVSVKAKKGSHMYHIPGIDLTSQLAKAMEKDIKTIKIEDEDEITPLFNLLKEINPEVVISGAIESKYQKNRIKNICNKINAECLTPLWRTDPFKTLEKIVEKFKIIIVGVAAEGLDKKWLGRIMTKKTIEDLKQLNKEKGIHPLGEGGEYETLVLAGPHMKGELEIEFEKKWDGIRGNLNIKNTKIKIGK